MRSGTRALYRFVVAVLCGAMLTGCVTLDDVRSATTLIRQDNELTRLLVEVRPGDRQAASIHLRGLAADARARAEERAAAGNDADAIAFYRIAATALWRAGDGGAASELFEVVEAGSALCVASGATSPDRDCVYLELIIPFASIEELFGDDGALMGADDLQVAAATFDAAQQARLANAYGALDEAGGSLDRMLRLGGDDRLASHPGMRDYYCEQVDRAVDRQGALSTLVASAVLRVQRTVPERMPAGICSDEPSCDAAIDRITAGAERRAEALDGLAACAAPD